GGLAVDIQGARIALFGYELGTVFDFHVFLMVALQAKIVKDYLQNRRFSRSQAPASISRQR
ncbi:MAG TPA: hypothetical protein VJ440_02505, partial [Candidatus Brocadiaceae bacterium]|nr:hypothetical protein [Candidatus Brocadiaceae bacterium]